MTKVLDASCVGGVVTVEGVPIDCTIITKGDGSSTGVVIINGEKIVYVASNKLDLEALITQLNSMFTQVNVIAAALDAVTNSPGSSTAAQAALATQNTALLALKDVLR